MSNIYRVDGDGHAKPLNRVRCKNESEELQTLLELNPDLLPGDQIRPDDPPRGRLP